MRTTKLGFAAALAGILSLGVAFSLEAQEAEYKPKAEVQSLHQGVLANIAGKTAIIKQFTLPGGFVGGKHYHPGNVYVYVLEGALTVETEKKVITVRAGELYPEVPGMVMQGKNASKSEPVKFVVFQIGETGKPMMIKAK